MTTHKVLFLPQEIEINVPHNYNLVHAAIDAGIHMDVSCGGNGVCGKCQVGIEEGHVRGGVNERFTCDDNKESNFRLACKSFVVCDVTVRVLKELNVDSDLVDFSSRSRLTVKIKEIDLNDLKDQGLFVPTVEKFFLEMTKPSEHDRLTDVSRILNYLKVEFGVKHVEMKLPVLRKIPDIVRNANFNVTVTIVRPVRDVDKIQIINIQPSNTTENNFAIAMDIGTTTVYGQLINLKDGAILAGYGAINKQVGFGEDIISRIIFAEKREGLNKINDALIETINEIISRLIQYSEVEMADISILTLAGNTTMTQLLLKINPAHIRISPYIPASTFYPPISVIDLGIALDEHAIVLVYPVIASYVGGDIVAGVMGSGMYSSDKLTLFMDIGTNAEIVLGNRDWLLCASCSAGPAFEGGGIEFGIRATLGAIEDFSIDPITLEPILTIIGDSYPKGICGSGLIAIVAVLFEMGIINNIGKFNRELSTSRIRQRKGIFEYVLVWADENQRDRDIVITEIDIENFIRTKGAIFSGCVSLLNEVGMSFEDIEQLILAGGFGSYINLDNAMTIGLLPEIDSNKVVFVGNSSLVGARMSSLTNRIRQDVSDVVKRMTNFELSEVSSYMDNYVASLFLPHTNINLFPKVNKRLSSRILNNKVINIR